MVISIINFKAGVGCSTIAYTLAQIFDTTYFAPDEDEIFLTFNRNRNKFDNKKYLDKPFNTNICEDITKYSIKSKKIDDGVYDIGSNNLEYNYSKKIILNSDVIIIPTENAANVHVNTINTIKFIKEINPDAIIFILFNRLDSNGTALEKRTTNYLVDNLFNANLLDEDKIYDIQKEELFYKLNIKKDKRTQEDKEEIQHLEKELRHKDIFYLRTNINLFKNTQYGNTMIDFFIKNNDSNKYISSLSTFAILQYMTYISILNKSKQEVKKSATNDKTVSKQTKKINKFELLSTSNWFSVLDKKFTKYQKDINLKDNDPSPLFNMKNIEDNDKLLKDILIISSFIKEIFVRENTYLNELETPIWIN